MRESGRFPRERFVLWRHNHEDIQYNTENACNTHVCECRKKQLHLFHVFIIIIIIIYSLFYLFIIFNLFIDVILVAFY